MENFLLNNWVPMYFLIGLIYVVINGVVRKMYDEGDSLLAFVHLFFWWVCFICLLVEFTKSRKIWKV